MNLHHTQNPLFFILVLLLMSSCASLPPNIDSPKTYALQDTADTHLGRGYAHLKPEDSTKSGFLLLGNSLDAFTARIELAKKAEKSIDAQYYMIHNDMIGLLFVEQLIEAADRGVRIRLLIDDMDLEGRDDGLSTLAFHPNINVRIFNPFNRQTYRTLQFISGFGSVTRRMHNKSFTIDNQATIVGGRNIGAEYFDANPALAFADLDILAIGEVVQEVSDSFDDYWNSSMAYPIKILHPDIVADTSYEEGIKRLADYLNQDSVKHYQHALKNSKLAKSIRSNTLIFTWGEASVLSDHPDKLKSYETDRALTLVSQLDPYLHTLNQEFLIFSPYFVPGKTGTKFLSDLSKKGVRVRIVTNSFASTDVGVVHAGYAKHRTTLLRAGVELYEMKDTFTEEQRKKEKLFSGSSKASLHAKSFTLDKKLVFIGSLNLDPRSIIENTEIGIMVHSRELAEALTVGFNKVTANYAFQLKLTTDEDGIEFITWHGLDTGKEQTWRTDPYTSFWQRMGIFFLGLFPVDSQL